MEMNGRLRLDKLANYIESFLKEYRDRQKRQNRPLSQQIPCDVTPPSPDYSDLFVSPVGRPKADRSPDNKSTSSGSEPSGPLYIPSTARSVTQTSQEKFQEEMESAVPLTTVLAGGNQLPGARQGSSSIFHPLLRRQRSVPLYPARSQVLSQAKVEALGNQTSSMPYGNQSRTSSPSLRQRRPLVNRQGKADLDKVGDSDDDPSLDFVTVPSWDVAQVEERAIPLIPFEDLMLIENLGTGRVSTIYRAAWKRSDIIGSAVSERVLNGQPTALSHEYVQMVALKVAMVNPETRDTSNVDELRREGDIAARLEHPNICDLVGVAADSEYVLILTSLRIVLAYLDCSFVV